MFKSFWDSEKQDSQPLPQEIPTNSWYPATQVSPSEAAGIVLLLKDRCIDELQKLLADKDAYRHFLLLLDQVKIQNNKAHLEAQKKLEPRDLGLSIYQLRDELQKETLQLARENLEKEPRIMELQNQCRIIRTTELAAAQEKQHELEKQKEETLESYSLSSLLCRLQEAMNKTEEESEALHRQLLDGEIELGPFVHKYKKLRSTCHRRALTHLAAKTLLTG